MSTMARTALQKWATARKTWATVVTEHDPNVAGRSQAIVSCGLLGMVFNYQKQENETVDECEERAATTFLEFIVKSPLGRR